MYSSNRHNLSITKAQLGHASSRSINLSIRCLGVFCCWRLPKKSEGAPFKLRLGGVLHLGALFIVIDVSEL
jgi:hypothetical protein